MTRFSVIPEAAKPLSGSRLERRSHKFNPAWLPAEAWWERPSGRETCFHYPVIPAHASGVSGMTGLFNYLQRYRA